MIFYCLDIGGIHGLLFKQGFSTTQKKINTILGNIPFVQNPKGWTRKSTFAIGGFEYFGFSETSDILVVLSAQGRGLIDMSKDEKIARDDSTDYILDETLLVCEGFDILEGETIKLAGEFGGSLLPVKNKSNERLVRVSPFYPCEDVIFQPPFESCFIERYNKNCVRVYRGYLYCYGFSFSGKYFVIADDGGITFWEADHAKLL